MIIVTLRANSIAWALYKLRMSAKLRPPESVLPDSNLGTYNLGITPSTRGVAAHATNIDDVRRPAKKRDRHFRF